jgi:hypothetical protein
MDIKKISELITYLEELKSKEGDIAICHSEPHEYWGSVENWLSTDFNLRVKHAQPDGPKSGISVIALVFGS